MIASAQFTIISLCDVVTSDTPPENPYEGQLWVDTSVTPPETKIWDGNKWVVQNDIETIRTTISILTEKDAQFQQTIDGLWRPSPKPWKRCPTTRASWRNGC